MTAKPRRIDPPSTPQRRSFLPSRHARRFGAAALAAGLVAGGVTATYALATPDEAAAPAPTRGAQSAGSVYANRVIPNGDLVAGSSRGQQFSYWTQGADKRMHLTTAVLLEPRGTAPAGGWPLVAYAHNAHGLSEACAPSTRPASVDVEEVSSLLRTDYAVLIPDYTTVDGKGASQFIDYNVTGRSIADAVSAATDVEPSISSKWAAVGNALGAGTAVELARKAATWQSGDLDFRGAAATDLPIELADTVAGLSPRSANVASDVVANVVYALASLDGDALEPILSQRGSALVTKARTLCAPALIKEIGSANLADLVRKPVSSNVALTRQLRTGLDLPSRGFSRPVLLSQKLFSGNTEFQSGVRYLATAQFGSNKVTAKTYLTGDPKDADRQERAAVSTFLAGLF